MSAPSTGGAWHPRALPRGRGAVHREQRGRIAELLLDNPDARNAISPGMMLDLEAHVCALEAAPALGLILRGEGGAAFCAGGDLSAVAEHLLEPGAGAGMCGFMTAILNRLRALPLLSVAAVEGAALGGGAEILSAVDLVVAAEGAKIGFVQAKLAVSPGWGGGQRLRQKVGPSAAARWLALAQIHPAEQAMRLGLVDEIAPRGQALDAARALLAPLEELSEEAVRGAISIARGAPPEDEAALFSRLWAGPAHLDAMARMGRSRR